MCGIAGFYSKSLTFNSEDLSKMTDALVHRGPDASGYFEYKHVGLGHRRLSIIDLSEAANQPMLSASGRFVMIYNGEVYNFREIAKSLQCTLKTTSDTEVVLEAFAECGSNFVNKLNGMFAFAIYDKQTGALFLARDRIGIKPLYYYWDGVNFIFASELKALLRLDLVRKNLKINKKALNAYLHLGYVPEPYSIYENIYKFPAGQYLKVSEGGLNFTTYWKPEDCITASAISDFEVAKSSLKEKLEKSIAYRLISDVPFGTFLSGGIDSSLVTAVAQKVSSEPVNTFSIGFKESKFNESDYAKQVANQLGTNHHELILSYADAIELFDDILKVYDEPFADSSSIPTMLVSKMAREHVKMTLSGDGGDETYMGYGFYKWAKRFDQPLFNSLRIPVGKVFSKMSSRYERVSRLLDYDENVDTKSHIFSQEQYYFTTKELEHLLTGEYIEAFQLDTSFGTLMRELNAEEEQALFDLHYYLKDDLLVKVDRASMHYSLETRVPLLDHELVSFALNVDPRLKIKGNTFKYLLKEVLYDYLPKELFDRPKWGFGMPLSSWLKKELRYLLDDYLSWEVIETAGIVDASYVQTLIKRYEGGKDYLYNRIWQLVVLHRWYLDIFQKARS